MILKKILIIAIIIAFLFAAFLCSKYLQKTIRPRESFGRLLLFMISCLSLIFLLSFIMVLIITSLFPGELIK
jgi:biotin transporter BioY